MPHTSVLIKKDSYDAVLKVALGNRILFESMLATAVADSFNRATGEELAPNLSSRVYTPIVTTSMPVDLTLQVAAWWSEAREAVYDLIVFELNRIISGWYEDRLKVEIYLNIIGAPEHS